MSMMVNPFWLQAAAPPSADVVIAVQEFNTPSSGTSPFSVTTTALGGRTPKAVLFLAANDGTTADAVETAHGQQGFGAFDGTRSASCTANSWNGMSSTNTWKRQDTAAPVMRMTANSSTLGPRITAASFISDGASLTPSGGAGKFIAIFFAGDDLDAYVGSLNLGTGSSAIDVTSPGFEPDAVICFGANMANGTSALQTYGCVFGIAANDGSNTQKCIMQAESYNVGAGNRPAMGVRSSYAFGRTNPADGTVTYSVTINDFDASGFSATPSASASSEDMLYLALKFGGMPFKLWDFDTPTATGVASDSTPGFEPQFALFAQSNMEARDTQVFDDIKSSGIGFSAIASESWAAATRLNYAADPSNTASIIAATAVQIPTNTTIGGVVAELSSFTSSGLDLNYTAVQSSPKMCFGLAVAS